MVAAVVSTGQHTGFSLGRKTAQARFFREKPGLRFSGKTWAFSIFGKMENWVFLEKPIFPDFREKSRKTQFSGKTAFFRILKRGAVFRHGLRKLGFSWQC